MVPYASLRTVFSMLVSHSSATCHRRGLTPQLQSSELTTPLHCVGLQCARLWCASTDLAMWHEV